MYRQKRFSRRIDKTPAFYHSLEKAMLAANDNITSPQRPKMDVFENFFYTFGELFKTINPYG